MIPSLWKSIGEEGFRRYTDTSPKVERDVDIFEQLPDERRREILGSAKFAAYRDGKLKLEDVAGFRRDPKWGPVGYEKPLREILEDAAPCLKATWSAAGVKAAATRKTAAAGGGGTGKGGRPAATAGGGGQSQDRVDRLIRGVVDQGRRFTPTERAQVQQRISSGVFNQQNIAAGIDLVGVQDSTGRVLARSTKLPALEQHWLQHVVVEGQWGAGVSEAGYLADLQQAASHPRARLFTYLYRGESCAALLVPDDFTQPGVVSYLYVFVAYSASWGVIRTGYKTTGMVYVFRGPVPSGLVEHHK